MHEQAKLQRVLKLIRLLLNSKYSINTLVQLIECSQSTIYKYFQLLEEIGYNIDKNEAGLYFIYAPNFLSNQFNAKEVDLIKNLVTALPNSIEAISILNKINLDPNVPSSEYLNAIETLQNLAKVNEAIKEKRWLNFEKYKSSNSNNISDRVVFPLEILQNGQIIGKDLNDSKSKTFKINRIGFISNNYENHPEPELSFFEELDMFGMSGKKEIIVKLLLTEQARNLLLEEYQDAINMTKSVISSKYHYELIIAVKNFAGIGRFVLGLPGEIEVLSPSEFIEYLKDRLSKSTFLDN
jgi:proteasome accessory factor C